MNPARIWATVLLGSGVLVSPALAGSLEVAPNIQNQVSVQNAQQIQLGFGVEKQEAVLLQDNSQRQFRVAPTTKREVYRRQLPIDKDISVSPNVQNAVGVQNAQQIQLALPEVNAPWR
jgi:hypothetical protein